VVWKHSQLPYSANHCQVLRENHSGMETCQVGCGVVLIRFCCVRTIVVWKRRIRGAERERVDLRCVRTIVVWKPEEHFRVLAQSVALRENHSGMETVNFRRTRPIVEMLRENHSGMETRYRVLPSLSSFRCVRTIVVWKLISILCLTDISFLLRENHSGMETGECRCGSYECVEVA